MTEASNVMITSNVYVLEGDFYKDKKFQSMIRGKRNLQEMIKVLEGLPGAVGINVETHGSVLTSLQLEEWKNDSYCTALHDRQELVFGVVKRANDFKLECRCYKLNCSNHSTCCSNIGGQSPLIWAPVAKKSVIENVIVELLVPEDVKSPEWEIDKEETEVIEFEEEIDAEDLNTEISAENLLIVNGIGEQNDIIMASTDTQMLVMAGPGTGKTYSLIKKLEFMVDHERTVDAENILILCFTRAAVKEIKERFKNAYLTASYSDGLSRLDIRTFDSFATRLLLVRNVNIVGLDYDTRIQMAIDEIIGDPEILQDMQHFIVDEIQDLVGVRARLVQTIIIYRPSKCGFTLLGDHLQGIYDYQMRNKPHELDAKRLLHWLEGTFNQNLKIVKLIGNRRQIDSLGKFSSESRKMLESGRSEQCTIFLNNIRRIASCGRDYNFAVPQDPSKKVAVLCRNNGEVLKLSGYLRERGINHQVRSHRKGHRLPAWVGDLLIGRKGTLRRDSFFDMVSNGDFNGIQNGQQIYYTLSQVVENGARNNSIKITEIKKALASGFRLPDEIYEGQDDHLSISTIHQSKGREFDCVVVKRPSGKAIEEELMEEAKVYYVAITRAKKELYTLEGSKSGAWMKKSEITNRFTERRNGSNGKTKLAGLEIGLENDIDEQGFVDGSVLADPSVNQTYIRNMLCPGDSIELHRISESDIYGIFHKQNLVGQMSKNFANEVLKVMREIYGGGYLPRGFKNIYLDDIYTIVRKPETIRSEVQEPYLSEGIWYGMSIAGMGKVFWDFAN